MLQFHSTFKRVATLLLGAAGADALLLEQNSDSPLNKVVHLLKNMQEQIKKEGTEDELIYSKLDCWCKTNRKEKTENVADGNDHIGVLSARIQELTGDKGELAAEIGRLQKEINENDASLAQLEAVEEKRAAKAHQLEKDYVESTTQLKAAITILSKHHPADDENSLVQEEESSSVKKIANLLQQTKTSKMFSSEDKQTLASLFQARPYASQSAEIYGFLKQMLETMEGDLATARAEAASALQLYTDTHSAKKAELSAQRSQLEHKQDLFGTGAVELANAKKELRETKDSVAADQRFLVSLEQRCSESDKEIDARRAQRAEELTVLQETVEILMTDDSRDLSRKTMSSGSSFFQMQSKAKKTKSQDPVSFVATNTQLDAFTVVKQAIDKLISDLKTKQQDEVNTRDYCVSSLDKNEADTLTTSHTQEDLQATSAELKAEIENLEKSILQLNSEIKDDQVELQKASQSRVEESKQYEMVHRDVSAMQDILHKAILSLRKFYNTPSPSSFSQKNFLQTKLNNKQDPPSDQLDKNGYSKQGSGKGAISLIEEILADQKKSLTLAVKAEQESQTSYESFVKETNDSVLKKEAVIVSTKEAKATAYETLSETKDDLHRALEHLEELDSLKKNLHTGCDFLLANFDSRQEGRATEIEALQQSKMILSGALN